MATSVTRLQIVLLLTFCHFGDGQSNYNDTTQRRCPREVSIDLRKASRSASGYFTDSGEFFPTHATRIVEGERRGCICDLKPCLAICPPEGADNGLRRVTDDYVNYTAIPKIHTTKQTIDQVSADIDPKEWFRIFVWDPCPGKYDSRPFLPAEHGEQGYEYYLLGDGSLFLPRANTTGAKFPDFGRYCLELQSDNSSYTPKVCWSDKDVIVYPDKLLNDIRYIAGLIALPFIIVTVIVYSILPELRNIHGTAFRCYLCCLAAMNVAVAADGIPGPDFEAGPWCLFLGFFIYFSFIASILWLNVVCVELWQRLGGSSSQLRISGIQNGRRKFFWYSVYAWGIPVLMTAICILMEFHPDIPKSLIRPGFRKRACWFETRAALALYHSGPPSLIILCNICLFISTSIKLYQHEKISERNFKTADSRRHNYNKQLFGLHLKLFILMGIGWSTEVISSLSMDRRSWFVPETVNALQGLLIFFIFVCKKNIWHSLNKRYGNKNPRATWCCHFGCFRTSENLSASQELCV